LDISLIQLQIKIIPLSGSISFNASSRPTKQSGIFFASFAKIMER